MKKEERLTDFAHHFSKVVSVLRSLRDDLEEKESVSKLLQCMPSSYDSLTLALEQFGDLNSINSRKL